MKRNIIYVALGACTVVMIAFRMNREISTSWFWIWLPVLLVIAAHLIHLLCKQEIYTEECTACEAECDIEDMACVEGEFFCYDCWLELAPGILAKKESAAEID